MRMPSHVEPPEIVEACGIDDEGIAFPMSNGITQPGGIEITDVLWKLAPVGVDRSMGTVRRLVKHHDQSGTLDDLRQTSKIEKRNAHRQAARERAVLSEILDPLLAQGLGPRLNVLRLQVYSDVEVVSVIAGTPCPPNAG